MNILTCRSSTSFADDVVQQLRDNAHELSKEPGIKAFCSALAAELTNVQHRLEELVDASSNAAEERRVLKLLDNLERLCHVGSRRLLKIGGTTWAANYSERPAFSEITNLCFTVANPIFCPLVPRRHHQSEAIPDPYTNLDEEAVGEESNEGFRR
jgi:hypothetical protein